MWTPGIEPGHEVLQTPALPSELSPRLAGAQLRRQIAANGNRTHIFPVDNRTLSPLSYGDGFSHQIVKEPRRTHTGPAYSGG